MYNFKLIKYSNGSAQIRIYNEPVGAEHSETGQAWEYEPFTMQKARVVKELEDHRGESAKKHCAHEKQDRDVCTLCRLGMVCYPDL